MPAWLAQALRVLALAFGGGVAFEGGSRILPGGTVVPGISGAVTGGPVGRVIEGFGDVLGLDERPRRRRRRRALTASDRADIAFIAGMISKAAAKDFAVQLAARPR